MVVSSFRGLAAFRAVGLLALFGVVCGCQTTAPVSSRRLIEHQAFIDFSGLKKSERVASVRTTIAAPRQWESMPLQNSPLYLHQQWRSPSAHTGVGVVLAHLPLPLSAQMVVWFAQREYSQKQKDGKVLDQWVDPLGRSWFEAENDKYHFRGYVVVKGFEAWVVYFGYRTQYPPDVAEISLAARSAETAVPMIDFSDAATTRPATQTVHSTEARFVAP
jgi:hypothetical protein